MYHYLNTKCGLFFIAFSPSYLYSIHILFPFSCSATVVFPIHSLLCSVFPYVFIISPCPCISKILFIFGEEKFFLAFFSGLASFSILSACLLFFSVLFDSSHFPSLQFKVLSFSRIPCFLCFLQPLILLLLLSIGYMFFCLFPMKCVGCFKPVCHSSF